MSFTKDAWVSALSLIPVERHTEFINFIETSIATDDFMAYLQSNVDCKAACEIMLRSDEEFAELIRIGMGTEDDDNDDEFDSEIDTVLFEKKDDHENNI